MPDPDEFDAFHVSSWRRIASTHTGGTARRSPLRRCHPTRSALRAEIGGMARPYIDAYQAQLPADERIPYDGPKSVPVEDVLTDERLAGLATVQEYERAAATASASYDDELDALMPVVWQDKLDEYFDYTD